MLSKSRFDLLSRLLPGIAITGTTTLGQAAIGRMHLISGTSASYSIGIPTAIGNGNSLIGFRVLPAASANKLYTLDGNSSETISGLTTRSLWAEEVAILQSDGANWYRIGGMLRPMQALMYLSASSSGFNHVTWTKAAVDTTDFDNTGFIADTTNKRLNCVRTSDYLVKAAATFDKTGATGGIPANCTRLLVRCRKNTTGNALVQVEQSGLAAAYPSPQAIGRVSLDATDYIEVEGLHLDTVNQLVFYGAASSPDNTALSFTEIITW